MAEGGERRSVIKYSETLAAAKKKKEKQGFIALMSTPLNLF